MGSSLTFWYNTTYAPDQGWSFDFMVLLQLFMLLYVARITYKNFLIVYEWDTVSHMSILKYIASFCILVFDAWIKNTLTIISTNFSTNLTCFEGDDSVTTVKFLLLVDQLSAEQKHHLSIKDIGIILDRLSSKILDVEKLDREKEDSDVYNWTIKATIRGDVMRELGVIYNSNYYSISEHPAYLPDPPSPDTEDLGD